MNKIKTEFHTDKCQQIVINSNLLFTADTYLLMLPCLYVPNGTNISGLHLIHTIILEASFYLKCKLSWWLKWLILVPESPPRPLPPPRPPKPPCRSFLRPSATSTLRFRSSNSWMIKEMFHVFHTNPWLQSHAYLRRENKNYIYMYVP